MKTHLKSGTNRVSACGRKGFEESDLLWNHDERELTCKICIKKKEERDLNYVSDHDNQHSAHYDGPFGWG